MSDLLTRLPSKLPICASDSRQRRTSNGWHWPYSMADANGIQYLCAMMHTHLGELAGPSAVAVRAREWNLVHPSQILRGRREGMWVSQAQCCTLLSDDK